MKTIKKEITALYLIQIANFGLPLIVIPYLTNVIGIDNFGKVGYFNAVVFFVGFCIDFGFTLSGARSIAVAETRFLNAIYTNIQFFRFLIFISTNTILLFLGSYSNVLEVSYYYYFLATLPIVFTPNWIYVGISNNSALAKMSLIVKILMTLPIFIFVKEPADFLKVILINCLSSIFLAIIVNIHIIRFTNLKLDFELLDNILMKKEVKEAYDNFIASFFTLGFTYLTPIVLKHLVGDAAVGIYSILDKLISLLRQIYAPINLIFYPKICKLYLDENLEQLQKLNKKVYLIYFMIGSIAWLGNYLIGDFILNFIFNEVGSEVSHSLNISIITQIVVSFAMVLVNFIIIPSGNAAILKKFYATAFIVYLLGLYFMKNTLNLMIILYMMLTIEVILTLSFYLYVRWKCLIRY